jgi:hypothetical protein
MIAPEKLCYISQWCLDPPLDVSLLCDRVLLEWIRKELAIEPKMVYRIDSAMADLKMRWTQGTPLDGVEELMQNLENILQNHGFTSLRDSEEGRAKLVKFLLRAVRPATLQEMLRREIMQDPTIGKDPFLFHRKLKEFAIMFDHVATCQRQVNSRSSFDNREKRDPGQTPVSKTSERTQNQTKKKDSGRSGQKRARSDKIDDEKGKDIICYNCHKKGHPRRLCPELKTNKKQKTSSQYNMVCVMNLESERTVLVQFDQDIIVPAILDSGANQVSLIPNHLAQKMLDANHNRLEKLHTPVLIKLGDSQSTIEVSEALTVDIKILTENGQIPIQCHRFLVWDVPSEEIILGSDILQLLGIDPYLALDNLTSKPRCDPKFTLSRTEEERVGYSIENAISHSIKAGLGTEWVDKLRNLLYKYINTFRVKMGADSPAKVTPFVTKLKPNAKPYKCKPRRYSQEQSQFLKDFTDELVTNGFIYENLNSEWASPVVVVKKAVGGHRMCVDLRAVNALSESTLWPMPFLESIVCYLGNSKFWFKLDAFKGFWLMPLALECQEMFSFMTDRAVFTPRRSIQGALNSATQFQSRMHEVFKELIFDKVIIWIDDLLGHASSLETWFSNLERVLNLATQSNIKFNVEKCEFFAREVKYCGRIFSTKGVSHDPSRVSALLEIPHPTTARDLQQFLMATQWMSRSIPEYNAKVYTLQFIFEKAMKGQPSRRKSIARQIKLSTVGWNDTHAQAFAELKQAIANHVRLSYPNKDMIQCLYTDANELNSSAVVTQIPVVDLSKITAQQRHEPLGFCGHKFSGSELNWSIVEKEGYAVVDALSKLDYLLMNDKPFRLYVDHKNLLQIFSPSSVSKPVAQKLQRWALEIQKFNYQIQYIKGEDNVWSDLMTRWGASPLTESVMVRTLSCRTSTSIPAEYRVRPLQRKEFVWPSTDEIRILQNEFFGVDIDTNGEGLYLTKTGKVRIPLEARDLRTRLCIIAHAGGNCGHLGYQAACSKLSQYFYWPNMSKDMRELCNSCLHCIPTRGGMRIPRPLGEAVHGQKPNQVVHLDWLYIMPAEKDGKHNFQWNLIMRDDLSGYIRVTPAAVPDSIITVDALMDWRASSRTPDILVTDMASYFTSAVMKEFTLRCNMRHHFTVAYGHYSNGSIEVINRHYLALIRALISELHWDKADWPWLNKNIEHTINHRPQARLGKNAPITVFTGQPPDNPLDEIFSRVRNDKLQYKVIPLDTLLRDVKQLEDSLAQMHKRIVITSEDQRRKNRIQPRIHRREPNFIVGDFVLVGDPDPVRRPGRKLFLLWKGPFRVTDVKNNYIFEVENIIDNTKRVVHGDRVRFFADDQLNITEEIKDQFTYDNASYEVEQFRDCRLNTDTHQVEFLVDWKGFSQTESTWEPLQNLWKDVPALVQRYHKSLKLSSHPLADMVLDNLKKWALH